MPCNAKTHFGHPCQKPPLAGKKRYHLHGGQSPSGVSHWNYQHGHCTKEYRKTTAEGNARKRIDAISYPSFGQD